MKRLYVILLVLGLILLAGTVSANAPIQNTGVWYGHFDLAYCDFPVYNDPIADYHEWLFFDKDDQFVEWRWHGVGTDYITAPSVSDVVLTGQFSITEEWNEPKQTFSATGMDMSITIPGHGVVLFEAGRGVFPPGKVVGIHTSGDPEKMAILCAALAGE